MAFLSAVGHVFSDIVGGIVGGAASEWRRKLGEKAGEEIKRVLLPTRGEVMAELLRHGDQTNDLVRLLEDANRNKFVKVGGSRYTENWIVNMLLKVRLEDREWVYLVLSRLCEQSRERLFTHLNILHNDGFLQWLAVAKDVIEETLPGFVGASDMNAANEKLCEVRDKLAANVARERKGWRTWRSI